MGRIGPIGPILPIPPIEVPSAYAPLDPPRSPAHKSPIMEPTAPANESPEAAAPAPALPPSETYALLDSGGGRVLERLGGDLLTVRPCPPAWWRRKLPPPDWRRAIDSRQAVKPGAPLKLKIGPIRFQLNPGASVRSLAPELEDHWEQIQALCAAFNNRYRLAPRVLHLYGGAGGATLAAAQAGAAVTHVDASADAIKRARDHAALNTLANRDIRWVVDDPVKFAQRERAQPAAGSNRYDLIILDPHTPGPRESQNQGRGAKSQPQPQGRDGGKNQVTISSARPSNFEPERDLPALLATASGLLSDKATAVLLFSRQGPAVSPTTLLHLFRQEFSVFGGTPSSGELLLSSEDTSVPAIPSGTFGLWTKTP